MPKKLATWVMVAAAAVMLLPAMADAKLNATSGGVGQYLVHKCGDQTNMNLYNPNRTDYFALFVTMDLGGDPQTDRAVRKMPAIRRFLLQERDEISSFDQTVTELHGLVHDDESEPAKPTGGTVA